MTVQFGLDTFGDVTRRRPGAASVTEAQVIRNVVEQGVLADQLGVDAFSVGEHHRPDFAVSAPDIGAGRPGDRDVAGSSSARPSSC
jgi:alkanesulfonate monooxygenase SsuD/methylene tetrahydromethanopterin reductase-like flavin-dependent oxidoreductase (luciferase family)